MEARRVQGCSSAGEGVKHGIPPRCVATKNAIEKFEWKHREVRAHGVEGRVQFRSSPRLRVVVSHAVLYEFHRRTIGRCTPAWLGTVTGWV